MIVNHLSRELGSRRLSVLEVQRRSGISYSALRDLYNDRTKRLDFDTLDRLCRVLGCGVGDLLEYRPDGDLPSTAAPSPRSTAGGSPWR